MILRGYQSDGVDAIRAAFRRGRRSVAYIAPTGSGKTLVLSYIARGATSKGNRITIVVHRQELIRQTAQALTEMGVEFGLIAAGHDSNPNHPVQLAMIQTLANRISTVTAPNLLIVDEFHHCVSPTYRSVVDHYSAAKILGMTATPQRLDGKGLATVCDELVVGPSVQELIDQGFLSRPVYYAPPTALSMEGVRRTAGDFNKRETAFRVDQPMIIGSAVEHYARLCPNQPAIVFCASIKHAENVRDQFNEAGFAAASIDGKLSEKDRLDRVTALSTGRIKVLTSVDVVSEGFDLPAVSVGIMLRPTESLALSLQQMGRVLRPSPGKERAVILDHVGNCFRHGLAETPREWTLKGHAESLGTSASERNFLATCPACFAVHPSAPKCPMCGHEYPPSERKVKEKAGTLEEIEAGKVMAEQKKRMDRIAVARAKTKEELEKIAEERGYAPAWVRMVLWTRRKAEMKRAPATAPERQQEMAL